MLLLLLLLRLAQVSLDTGEPVLYTLKTRSIRRTVVALEERKKKIKEKKKGNIIDMGDSGAAD